MILNKEKMAHTTVSAIKASSATLSTCQKEPEANTVFGNFLKLFSWSHLLSMKF